MNKYLWFAIVFSILLSSCASREERVLRKIERAVYKEDFEKGIEIANNFYLQKDKAHPSEKAMALRSEISAYTKLCLLKTSNLNNTFLSYYPIREMGAMFGGPLPGISSNAYIYARLYTELGLYGPALPIILWRAEDLGWDKETADLAMRVFLSTSQYRVAQNYLNFFSSFRTLRKPSLKWQGVLDSCVIPSLDGTLPLAINDSNLFIQNGNMGYFIDEWVRVGFEFGLQNTCLTDYYTLLCLLYKDMDKVPVLVKQYKKELRVLPDYLQEAVLICSAVNILANNRLVVDFEKDIKPEIKQRVERVLNDFEMLKLGAIPFETITERYAATYTYHFLFGQLQ